jgi:hypothetical protein
MVVRRSRMVNFRLGHSFFKWHAALMPDKPAPMIKMSSSNIAMVSPCGCALFFIVPIFSGLKTAFAFPFQICPNLSSALKTQGKLGSTGSAINTPPHFQRGTPCRPFKPK